MASGQSGVWGIDVGQCGVKAIRLENFGDETTATAFDYIEYPKILTQPDADPDQLIREALEQFLSRNNIRGDTVVIAVPGQSGLARFVKLPPVEERKIADIVRFEAKQQIPFPLEEVVWDFQKLGSGEVNDGFAMGTEIGLFALKRDMVFRYLQHFKDVGVEVQIVQMAPLALCNFVAFDLIAQDRKEEEGEEEGAEDAGKKKCVVALDIGTDNSNLVITDGDCIIWQRPIPLGGNHFTRALTKDMKLTFAKAEHLKRNAVKSPELRKILASLKTVLNDFVGEVQRSLGYFTNTHRDAKIQYMIGLGNAFRLPGLQKYLQEKLQLEVRKFTKLGRVEGDEVTGAPTFTENLPSFAVAYGLALQGVNKTRLTTNLLPYEVHLERLVRGKKPWAVTAAACLLLVVGGLTFARAVERDSFTGPDIDDAVTKSAAAIKAKEDLDGQYKAMEIQLEKAKLDLRKLAAGVDERWNWQLLHEYINLCLPQPNGTRLFEEARDHTKPRASFYTAKAKEAFQLLEQKRLTDNKELSPEKAKDNDILIKKHLVQVNLEAITVRFADDLMPFYSSLVRDPNAIFWGLDSTDEQKLKDIKATGKKPADMADKGWVVEIRGYTYHEAKLDFVQNTFVENLFRFKELANMPENRAILDRPFQPGTPKPTLRDMMMERIEAKKSMLFLYKIKEVENPTPGVFAWIGNTNLDAVNSEGAGGAAAGAPGKDAGKAGPARGGKGGGKGDRSKWVAGQGVGSRASAAAPAAPATGQPGQVGDGVARTEFIVMFVWQEPFLDSERFYGAAAPAAPSLPAKK